MNDHGLMHIIYLRSGPIVLSKKPYADWHAIQAAYPDYMASLSPKTAAEIIDFFTNDFGNEADWPLSGEAIELFVQSDVEDIYSSR